MSLRKIKEIQFIEVLQKLNLRFGPAQTKILIAPAKEKNIPVNDARGLVNGNQNLPLLDDAFQSLADKQTPQRLISGEWFRIGVWTPLPGRLFLFNLGVSGGNARLAPLDGYGAKRIEAKQLYLIGDGRNPIAPPNGGTSFQETCRTQEHMVYPERLLAIVLSQADQEITASDLNPDWDPETRGGFGHVNSGASAFWEQPKESITWGLLELPIQPQPKKTKPIS